MKKIVTFLFFTLFINVLSFAQTHIPDKNFANAIRQQCPSCIDMNDNLTAAADTLQYLNVSNKYIKSLMGLEGFINLKKIDCNRNYLTSLSTLPKSLNILNCEQNYIKSLPDLPASLITLNCSANQIESLPDLPASLIILNCDANPVISLPVLPQKLITLSCFFTEIDSLPILPTNLEILQCSSNDLVSLPVLPSSLIILSCYNNNLKTLPSLPLNLTRLDCFGNQLTSLPNLSSSLIILNCAGNQIKNLPDLPPNLTNLSCSSNQLTSLPNLPTTLENLNCGFDSLLTTFPTLPQNLLVLSCIESKLKNLPTLPNSLQELNCEANQLIALPILPQNLQQLYCSYNQIKVLPTLPQNLKYLNCDNNQLTTLPAFPANLEFISCNDNKNLFCINNLLPSKLKTLKVDFTGIECIPNKPINLNFTLPICDATNSGTCFNFPKITGNVFIDYNDDGIKNNEDVFVSNQMIEIKPYGFALTNSKGDFIQASDTSQSITIKLKEISNNFEIKPNERSLKTTSTFAQSYDKQDFRLVPKQIIGDMEVSIVSSVQRPGFEGTLTLTYRNIGTTVLFGQVKLEKDPILTYLSAIPKENAINGHTIVWDYKDLKPFETRTITVKVKVPATTPINTKLTNKMFASYNVLNNYYETEKVAEITTVVGSYDPNDKTASVKTLDPQDIIERKPITYTIRFQNTGNYHAERVEIQDTISANFDLSTFKNIAVSHPNCTVSFEKDRFKAGQPTVIKWTFEPIFLPDSTANEPASHGFVRFSIQPIQGLPIGTVLDNKAYIYFDFNLPIITNTSTVKVEKTIKVKQIATEIPLKVYPNPSSDRLFVETSEDLKGEFILTNLLGQVIEYQTNNSTGATIFDLQYLPKGVYILTLKTEQGSVSRKVVRE